MKTFWSGRLEVTIDAERGGRLASLRIDGIELLWTEENPDDAMLWGSYPMVPWAGRVRDARFDYDGRNVALPVDMAPHAIHGTGYLRNWTWETDGSLRTELGADWPFGGWVEQRFELTDDRLTTTMRVHATEAAMPVVMGWHPWFRREVSGQQSELRFVPGAMYALDDAQIPTGELIDPPPGPWDNCFVQLSANPALCWPGVGELEVSATTDHWVIYDQPDHAICVEPQSGPPDGFNLDRFVTVEPGAPFEAAYTLRWRQ